MYLSTAHTRQREQLKNMSKTTQRRKLSRLSTAGKGRHSAPRLSSTSFHITALGQFNIDRTEQEIQDCVKAYADEETVKVQYIDKFTKDEIADIRSLRSENVSINIGNVALFVVFIQVILARSNVDILQ